MEELINSVILWWEEAKNETVICCGNTFFKYDKPPEFVNIAFELQKSR